MAVCAFVRSLLRCRSLPVETGQDALLELTETVIRSVTKEIRSELEVLYELALHHATGDEKRYLPIILERIRLGSLAELMQERFRDEKEIIPVLSDMAECLRSNLSYSR
jgi:glutamate---cysteine ligase / carboxylate-amine ligase